MTYRLVVIGSLALMQGQQALARHDRQQAVWRDRVEERGTILRPPILPAPFRGHWSASLAECAKPAVDDSQLWLTGTSLDYYETIGHLTRVVVENGRRAVVTVRSEGEGTIFVMRKIVTLSADRRVLTLRDQEDTGTQQLRRCPAETSPRSRRRPPRSR